MTEENPQAPYLELEAGFQIGEYRIENKLGEGGFGAVYRAVHPLIGKAAAIKVLNRQYSSNPQMVSRFIAEARAVNQIRHRSIIDIFSFGGLPDGRQYYVMELLDGMTFDGYLDKHGRLSPEVALPILRQMAKALDAAHAAGIAHRDLKPENIFLQIESDGTIFPKLLDFGIAKLLHDEPDGQSGSIKTRTGTPMGTPYYMSPEQCRGINVDHRTDIYSFGVMTFKVLTGHLPFDADTTVDLLFKHLSEPPPRPSQVCPELPAAFDEPILHMLEKDPQKRPQTVSAAVDGLLRAAAIPGLPASTPSAHVPMGLGGAGADSNARTITSPDAAKSSPSVVSTTLVAAQSPRKPLPLVLAGVAAVAVLGGAAAWLRPQPPADHATAASAAATSAAPPATSAPAAVTSAPPSVSVVPVASAAAATVNLTIEDAPPSTVVSLGSTKLGVTPGPFPFPPGSAPLKLTLKAPGYATKTVEFTPLVSGSISAKMSKVKAAAAGNGDLEKPY